MATKRRNTQFSEQLPLPLGPIRNASFFSNHWLEHRLLLEPEWAELRDEASRVLDQLADIWRKQRDRVRKYAEPTLEQAFIQPVLKELQWDFIYQPHLRRRRPDYAFFLDDSNLGAAVKAGRKSPRFWDHAALVGDAKPWDFDLDRPTIVQEKREYPPEQIEWYLTQSKVDYAILTNGKLWRLIPRELERHQRRFETYLECDLAFLLDLWVGKGTKKGQRTFERQQRIIDDFLRFYLFFTPQAFRVVSGRSPLIERAIKGSSDYRLGIGEGLKRRVFKALRNCIQGFLAHGPNHLDPDKDMMLCREQSFILLYRLLFVMYAEDRGLLPYPSNDLYTRNRSLGRLRDEIGHRVDLAEAGRADDYREERCDLWEDLKSLFDLIDRGGSRYGVPAYNGGLFDPTQNAFLGQKVLSDRYVAKAIDWLGRAPDPAHPNAGFFRVDYRDLSIQHLGNIYEGLLELSPRFATEPMIVVKALKRGHPEETVVRESEGAANGYEATSTRYCPGDVYLLTEKAERRSTGSYYTPDYVVNYIVRRTLGPLCRRIGKELGREIEKTRRQYSRRRGRNREILAKKLEQLQSDFDDRVLRLRILDPAMGSGHFLLRACQYLAEEIATNPNTGDPDATQLQEDESLLTFWKRKIAEHTLYGVDINPLAVELGKLALWLETASANQPLTFLDHHLRCGNTLIGARVSEVGVLPGSEPLVRSAYEARVTERLPILLQGLSEIDSTPSDTADHVKTKYRIYQQAVDEVRKPFVAMADLWCAAFFLEKKAELTPAQYDTALAGLPNGRKRKGVEKQPWYQRGIRSAKRDRIRCFHWELEFPEVFFDLSGRSEEGGFDAILGNPPYGLITSDRCPSGVPSYLSRYDVWQYKPDLFHLFIEKGIDLLREKGVLGYIVPAPWLTMKFTERLRRHVLTNTAIDELVVFDHRVFESADVYTVLLFLSKGRGSPQHAVAVKRPRDARGLTNIDQAKASSVLQQVWENNKRSVIETRLVGPAGNIVSRMVRTYPALGSVARASLGCQAYNKTKHSPDQIAQRVFHAKKKLSAQYLPELAGRDVARYVVDRQRGQWIKYGPWLHDYRTMDWLTGARILVREIPGPAPYQIQACYLEETYCNYKTILNVNPSDSTSFSMKYLCGLLNSKLISFVYPYVSNKMVARSFPRVSVGDLRRLPISTPGSSKAKDKARHDRMVQLVEQMLKLHKDLPAARTAHDKTLLQRQIDATDKQIDQLVYELYELTEEEIRIVEEGITP